MLFVLLYLNTNSSFFYFLKTTLTTLPIGKQHILAAWDYVLYFSSFERVLCCCTRNVVGLCCLCCCKFRLLDYAFFEVLGEVHTCLLCSVISSHLLHIGLYHQLHQLLEASLGWVPAQCLLCFGWVTPQVHHIRWTVEVRTHLNQGLTHQVPRTCYADTFLIGTFATELQGDTHLFERQVAELAHRVLLACSYHEVLWRLVLQYQPHALHIVLGISPVA